MNEQPKLHLLLEMLLFLSSGLRYTIEEIAERFDISVRTAYRYISTFRDAGFIIPKPRRGYYAIDKTSPYFREISELLHFSREEAVILQKAIHSIDNENLLKQNLIHKLYALYDFNRVANTIVKKAYSENIHQLIQAIKHKNQVILKEYLSANSNEARDRLVEPFDFTTNYVATWAYDIQSKCCKTFKNTRIKSVRVLAEPWQHAVKHKKMPIDVFRISSNRQIQVTLKLSIRACELLKEEYPLAEEYIIPVNERQFLFTTRVCSFDGIGRFVMGLHDEIEVIEPEDFKQFLKTHAKKILTDMG
ncbi:MAG: transcriptional regulator [Bacteroidales bacterium]|nr:transcriptional regulator [Bacteroidales bacterium]HPE86492.1 transcriptional regulator [Bacteroidales bacterium]